MIVISFVNYSNFSIVQKVGSLTVNYLETSFSELFKQANVLEKDCEPAESESLRKVVSGKKS